MADLYSSYAALAAGQTENVDYTRMVIDPGVSTWASIAIHGGSIEAGSGEVARAVARATMAFYEFAGIMPSNNFDTLHLTSTLFDEPMGVAVVGASDRTLSFHGYTGTAGVPETAIGGLDTELAAMISDALTAAGFTVVSAPSEIAGTDPDNICNRNARSAGVQLELSSALRASFFPGDTTARATRETGQRTATFEAYVAAIRSVYDAMTDAPRDGAVTTWTTPQLVADWEGHGSTAGINDLSRQAGGFIVTQALDDGLPDAVSGSMNSEPYGTLRSALAGRPASSATAISWRTPATAVNGAASATSGTVSAPSSLVEGDPLIIAVSTNASGATITPPAGFDELIPETADGNLRLAVFWRRAGGGDIGASYTFTFGAACPFSIVASAPYATGRGARRPHVAPVAGAAQAETGTSVIAHSAPSVELSRRGAVLGVWTRSANANTWSPPTDDTELTEVVGTHGTANNAALALSYTTLSDAGTYTKTATTGSGSSVCVMGAVPIEVYEHDALSGVEYFSPYNDASPVADFPRDTAAMTLDHGPLTELGAARERLFTGQMASLTTDGNNATVNGISATRLLLAKQVQPPPVYGRLYGSNSSWLVSWTLQQCGLGISPQPRDGTRLWIPMHGSLQPFLPAGDTLAAASGAYYQNADEATRPRPTWVDGPFYVAFDGYSNATEAQRVVLSSIDLDEGDDLFSTAANRARVEFWIKGDTFATPPTSAPLAGTPSSIAAFTIGSTSSGPYAQIGVSLAREVFVRVFDGTNMQVLTHTTTLPTDGAWHAVGASWNVSTGALTVYHDGAEESSSVVLSTAGLSSSDSSTRTFFSWLPASDLYVTTGANAVPATAGWYGDEAFTAPATVRPSAAEREAFVYTAPIEAWNLLADLAEAEFASYRCDELDRYNWLPLSYFGEAEQQTVATYNRLHTGRNARPLKLVEDPSKVRNVVTVKFREMRVGGTGSWVLQDSSVYRIRPGTTTLTVALDVPAARIAQYDIEALSAADIAAGPDALSPGTSYVAINTADDGGGTYVTDGSVSAALVSYDAGSAVLRFTNRTRRTHYVASSSSTPALTLSGYAASYADGYSTARADTDGARGERSLSITLDSIDGREQAAAAAGLLVTLTAGTQAEGTVEVFGDPRRQPGQLVQLDDPYRTKLSGLWRVLAVTHTASGPEFEQTLYVRRQVSESAWDVALWDEGVWAP